MSNAFGKNLRFTLFGQSHGEAIGAVVEGLPPGLAFDMEAICAFMARRAPGGPLATARRESDVPRIVSGLNERGLTCGAPLCALIENADARSGDYQSLYRAPRPGHADYTARMKYGEGRDVRGGGQFSGRLTAPLCFVGALCMQLPALSGVRVYAHLLSVADVTDTSMDAMGANLADCEKLAGMPLPVLSADAADAMHQAIQAAREAGDSVGGVIEVMAVGVPGGYGEPMFDGVENKVAQLLFGIPGVRGVEFGLGFQAARMTGSAHNDPFVSDGQGGVVPGTNRHGGILGGITTGTPILARVAVKPTPTIARVQQSAAFVGGEPVQLQVGGRHDPCIAPRAVPCVEAALWIAIADMLLS